MSESHLKSRQYYSDLYDRHTVEQCRWWDERPTDLESLRKSYREKYPDKELDEKELVRTANAFARVHMYFIKGKRYIKKEETVREWMQRDEQRDQFLETTPTPENIMCLTCGRLMFSNSKHLHIGGMDERDRILFFFECPLEHTPLRAFYNDGEEFRPTKTLCPKCSVEVVEEDKTTDEKFITVITCPNCTYTETTEIERTIDRPDPNFERDRARFCLTEKEGGEFIQGKANIEGLARLMDEIEEKKKHKNLYDEVKKLRKLKIIELEELLIPILEKADYIKLQFKTPEITKDVIVPFVVYEKRPDREGYSSSKGLEKLLRKTLADTNWRPMTDGVSYRLGMLEGRLHGYEREEDLLRLVKDKESHA
jgi:predicted pyridoxine 5'-phosphate oxidase superfamily flavin-nucleotide-binding protein